MYEGARSVRPSSRASAESEVGPKRKKRRMIMRRKRVLDPSLIVDYKNPEILQRFVTDRGKIIPRRISGATQEQQRRISIAIKRARFLGLLSYAINHVTERGFAGDMQQAVQAFSTAFAKTGRPPYGAGKPDDRHSGGHRSRGS